MMASKESYRLLSLGESSWRERGREGEREGGEREVGHGIAGGEESTIPSKSVSSWRLLGWTGPSLWLGRHSHH